MSKKLLKYFKNREAQIAVEGVLTTATIIDADNDYIFLGVDGEVHMAIPIKNLPVVLSTEISVTGSLEEMLEEVAREKKKGPLQ